MSEILEIRAHVTRHMHVAVFDFYVAPHMWNILKKFKKACICGHLKTMKYFILIGADVHVDDDYALCCAARYGHIDIMKYLVLVGVDTSRNYAIQWAAAHGNLNAVDYLISVGADVHANKDEAVRLAAENGHLEVVKYLVLEGANRCG